MPKAPVFYQQNAVAVSVETFDDPCKALVDFGLRFITVAITVEKLKATDLERLRHFTPKTGELLQVKFAVAVAVVTGAAFRPRGVDLALCDHAEALNEILNCRNPKVWTYSAAAAAS